jgi:hypothetical protein
MISSELVTIGDLGAEAVIPGAEIGEELVQAMIKDFLPYYP